MNKDISLGLNSFVPGRDDLPILDLDSCVSPSLKMVKDKIMDRMREFPPNRLFGTRMMEEQENLKGDILRYLQIDNDIKKENIIFGFGSYSILERIAWKVLDSGVLLGHLPQFRYFPLEYVRKGGAYQGLWEKDLALPVESMLDSIKNTPELRCVYINNPVNPTGQIWDEEQLLAVVQESRRRGVSVIVDEVYGDLLDVSYSFARYVESFSNLIVVRSFSKVFGLQNARVGYLIANEVFIKKYLEVRNWDEMTNGGVIIAQEVLRSAGYRDALLRECEATKPEVQKILAQKGFAAVDGSPRVPLAYFRDPSGNDLAEYFRERSIKVEGSIVLQSLDKTFPIDYARVRIPVSLEALTELEKRL